MEIIGTVVFLSAILNFLLGLFVFLKNPQAKLNRLFGIFGTITAIWILSNFLMGVRGTIFWLKNTSAFGALVPISALFWVFELCEIKIRKKNLFLFSGLGLLFFIISYLNDLIVANVKRIYLGGFEGNTGPFFPLYTFYVFGILSFIIYLLFSKYYRAKGIRKLQISYVIFGAILYITNVLIVSLILPLFGILKFTALDSPSSLFLVFFTTLAITRYHLFEIRVILTELLVGIMGVVLLILPFLMPSVNLKILTLLVFLLFLIFGYYLLKVTHEESKRREKAEKIAIREKALREKTEKLYKELEALDKAKSEFISMASHQLRTPLTAIKGYISMMLEGSYDHLPSKVKEKMRNVFHSTERLIRIVNDLLNISKIELGKMELEKEETQIEDLIQSCCEELKIEAKKKGLNFTFKKPKFPLPKIKIDQLKIMQVILNLIDNAIRYTQKGEIEIKTQKQNSQILISIRDTGQGLTEEEKKKIFEGFVRGSAGTTYWIEGAGLGLYVAKKYVELHNGKIWVESEGKGKGSTFFVELPIK